MKEKEGRESENRFFLKELVTRISPLFAKTRKVVTDFFLRSNIESDIEGETFETEFSPSKYVELYYPEIQAEMFPNVSEIIKKLETNGPICNQIDGEQLKQEIERVFPGNVNGAELMENFCIYDFILRRALKRMLEIRPDDHFNILDVGGGPTIYQHIPLAPVARNITHSEFVTSNRECVRSWLAGSGHDWSSYTRCCQIGLGSFLDSYSTARDTVKRRISDLVRVGDEDYTKYLKSILGDILPVDVFAPDLKQVGGEFDVINLGKWGSVDLLTSHFCIESATADPEKWKIGIENIGKKVAPGGFLLMTAIRDAEWYKVGENQLPAVPIDAETVNRELVNNGFKILEETELLNPDQKPSVGYGGMIFILAQKI